MKNLILRFTLSAALFAAVAATPALATGPGDPPPPGTTSISTLVLILSSLIPL